MATSFRSKYPIVIIQRSQIESMLDAQLAAKRYIETNETNKSTIQNGVSFGAGVLGLVFALNTPASVALGIASLATALTSSMKQSLLGNLGEGTHGLIALKQKMDIIGTPQVEVELPRVEIFNQATAKTIIAFVQGEPFIRAFWKNGTKHTLERP